MRERRNDNAETASGGGGVGEIKGCRIARRICEVCEVADVLVKRDKGKGELDKGGAAKGKERMGSSELLSG